MPNCAVRCCKNSSKKKQKKDGISYFIFPHNEIRKEKWRLIIAQQRNDEFYKPTKASVVCSDHFFESDIYVTNKGYRKLYKSAIPKRNFEIQTISPSSSTSLGSISNASCENTLDFQSSTSRISQILDEHNYCGSESAEYSKDTMEKDVQLCPSQSQNIFNDTSEMEHLTDNLTIMEPTSTFSSMAIINTPRKIAQKKEFHMQKCKKNILSNISAVRKSTQSVPDQVLQSSAIEINYTVSSPSTSLILGSALDTPHKTVIKKDLKRCQNLLLKKNKEIRNLHRINKRLKKKNTSLKTAMSVLRKHKDLDQSVLSDLSHHVEVTDMFNALFVKNNRNKKRPFSKYPAGARKFALTLHFYSPAAYRYIRKIFDTCLPHPSTLYQWYRSVDAEPGFTIEAFDRLKQKSESGKKSLICALMADEMSIRQQQIWCRGRYIGVVDMGLGETTDNDPIAQQAYVLLLVSLNECFKIPIAYFFVNGLKAETKANIIKIALEKCHAAGVKVVTLTFDGCKSNILTMKLLGCNLDDINQYKTHFRHPSDNTEVVVFLDACHMIKLMRNTFESKKCITDNENKLIKWSLLCELNNLQKNIALNLANKLTTRHIEFKNEIMKVKLATQLMSRSVAKAIQFCDEVLKLTEFNNSEATVRFLLLLNDLFDILNSRNLKDPGLKKPLHDKNVNTIFAFLESAQSYLRCLSITVKKKRTIKKKNETRVIFTSDKVPLWKCQANTGVIGLLVCIKSVQHLYKNIVETKYLSFLLTYKISQDHIEIFFSNIRSQGGFNNNPNALQFKAAYKKILAHIEIGEKFTGNCIPLEETPILSCGSTISNINRSSIGYRQENDEEEESQKHDADEAELQKYLNNCDAFSSSLDQDHNSELVDQIVGYISGFVVRYLIKHLKCESCKDVMLAKQKLHFYKLIDLRDIGGLCYASNDVFLVCKKSEDHIRRVIRAGMKCLKDRMTLAILKEFVAVETFESLTCTHRVDLMKALIGKYIDTRLHYAGKLKTAENKERSKRQLYNKLNLFHGN